MNRQSNRQAAVEGCEVAVRRCLEALEAVSQDEYAAQIPEFGTIGSHVRHIIDHFACFCAGYETGVADYDARERDETVETSLDTGRVRLEAALDTLQNIGASSEDGPFRIRQLACPGGAPITLQSTLERELLFLSGHTIHHLAMMLLIANSLNVPVPTELGLAFSTQAYRAPAGG